MVAIHDLDVRPELKGADQLDALDVHRRHPQLAPHVGPAEIRPIQQVIQGRERLGCLASDPLELDRREAARLLAVRRLLRDLVLRAVRGPFLLCTT